ncbi:hypothetical protein RRF57_006611 [Xylaria bambusicola]|uniref:Uncharacterized protein n=1 Tax=Xylaria bambusicola TaxID=326684 RepID=A0AAN7USE0_9PEZI
MVLLHTHTRAVYFMEEFRPAVSSAQEHWEPVVAGHCSIESRDMYVYANLVRDLMPSLELALNWHSRYPGYSLAADLARRQSVPFTTCQAPQQRPQYIHTSAVSTSADRVTCLRLLAAGVGFCSGLGCGHGCGHGCGPYDDGD